MLAIILVALLTMNPVQPVHQDISLHYRDKLITTITHAHFDVPFTSKTFVNIGRLHTLMQQLERNVHKDQINAIMDINVKLSMYTFD